MHAWVIKATPLAHESQAVQTLSLVAVGPAVSYVFPALQLLMAWQTLRAWGGVGESVINLFKNSLFTPRLPTPHRLLVAVGGAAWNWVLEQGVSDRQTRSLVIVGATA